MSPYIEQAARWAKLPIKVEYECPMMLGTYCVVYESWYINVGNDDALASDPADATRAYVALRDRMESGHE